jgi:hypothetical protein
VPLNTCKRGELEEFIVHICYELIDMEILHKG